MTEKLFAVLGEYDFSRNGDVAWIVGVARTEDGARKLAEADAAGYGSDEVVSIGGERYDPERKSYDPPDEDDADDWGDDDWTVTYSWAAHEVAP